MDCEFKLRVEVTASNEKDPIVFEGKAFDSSECPRAKPSRDENGDLKEDASQDIEVSLGWWFILRGDKELTKPLRCKSRHEKIKFPTKGTIYASLFISATNEVCFEFPSMPYDLGVNELSNAVFHVDKRRNEKSEKPTDWLILRIQSGELYCVRLFLPLEQLPSELVNDDVRELAQEERRNRLRQVIEEIIQPKSLSKEELKYHLKLRGLTTSGSREELVERLENCLRRKTSKEDTQRIIEAQKRAEKRGTPFEKNIRKPRKKNTRKTETLSSLTEEKPPEKKEEEEETKESPSAIEKIQREYEKLEPLLATPATNLSMEASDNEENRTDSLILSKKLNFSPEKLIIPVSETKEPKVVPKPEILKPEIRKIDSPKKESPFVIASKTPKAKIVSNADKENEVLNRVQNASPTELRKTLFQLSQQSPLRVKILELLQSSKLCLNIQNPETPISRIKKQKTPNSRKSLGPMNKGNFSSLFSGEKFAIPKLKRAAEDDLAIQRKSRKL